MSITNNEPFEDIFVIKVSEIQYLARKKFGRFLDEIEIKEVQKRMQWGLECWEEVALYAIKDVVNKKK
jgi:virulence-associated protein VapD